MIIYLVKSHEWSLEKVLECMKTLSIPCRGRKVVLEKQICSIVSHSNYHVGCLYLPV